MSIVKDSIVLKEAIHNRLKELYPSNAISGFKQSAVIKDAEERGFVISSSSLSRYIKGESQNSSLSESQILWLGIRYGIPIRLVVGNPLIIDGKIDYTIPPLNEVSALKLLKLIFP